MSRLCTSTSSPKDVSCGAVLLENSLLVLTLLDRAWDTERCVTSLCYLACTCRLRKLGTRGMSGEELPRPEQQENLHKPVVWLSSYSKHSSGISWQLPPHLGAGTGSECSGAPAGILHLDTT